MVTLTKPENRGFNPKCAPGEEQFHLLPHYAPEETDEFGSKQGQEEKAKSGALEILTK